MRRGGKCRRTAALLWSALLFFCAGMPVLAAPAGDREAVPAVSSLSAAVYEPQSGTFLYEKDAHTARPMASTTKLMTALLAAECLDPDSSVSVPAAALPVEGTQIGLAAGDTVTVRDLLAGLLLASGNDTANALALLMDDSFSAFSARMNDRAQALGMADSHFVTPSGLDAEGHAATAADMARLGAAVLQKPLLAELCRSQTAAVTVSGRRMTLSNHNKLLRLCDGCIGLKTGFTKKAGRCLISAAERNGVTLIVATLKGGDDWNDHIALYRYAFSLVRGETLPDVAPTACAVAGGTAAAVPLTAAAPPFCVLKKDETVRTEVELLSFVWAPVTAGQRLGQVRYLAGGRLLAELPLYAGETVEARPVPNFVQRLRRHLGQLFGALLR